MYLLALVNLASSSSQHKLRLSKKRLKKPRPAQGDDDGVDSDGGGGGSRGQQPPQSPLEKEGDTRSAAMVNNNPRRAKPRGKVTNRRKTRKRIDLESLFGSCVTGLPPVKRGFGEGMDS